MFRRINVLLLIVLFIGVCSTPVLSYDNTQEMIIDVTTASRDEVAKIANMGIDIANVSKGKTTVVVRNKELNELKEAGFKCEVNIDQITSSELKLRFAAKSRAGDNSGKYHSYAEVNAELTEMAKKYPKIAKVQKIGKSFEGRDVYALRISGAGTKKVPKAIFMGTHHAREWIATEVPIYIARELLNKYGKDNKITELVNNRVVFIVPVVNPDGLQWSQTEYSYWRKNRNDNGGSSKKGVDPNRNYGYQWGNVGASTYMGSDTYHGTGPFSEPCCLNIKKLAEKEKFTASLSYHSYSQLVLYPFGYAYDVPNPDEALFKRLANQMGKLTGYRAQNSAELYPAMGDSDDWLYGSMGILSFTMELGKRFVPSESQIDSICAKNVKAALYLLDEIGTVHASNHPDKVSSVKFRTARADYLAQQAEVYKKKNETYASFEGVLRGLESEKTRLVYLLSPENDENGKKLEEFINLISQMKDEKRAYFLPVISEVKALCLNAIENGGDKADLTKRVDLMENLAK